MLQRCNGETLQRQIAATRDACADLLQSVRDTVTLYYNEVKKKIRPGTSLHEEIKAEAQESYYDAEDIQDEYHEIEDIQLHVSSTKN